MVSPEQLQSYVRGNVLKTGEEVLWQGRSIAPTDAKRKYLGDYPSTVISGYLLTLIALFTLLTLPATWVSFFAVLVGAWFAGGPFRLAKRLKHTFHFITNQRVMVVRVGQRVRINDIPVSSHLQAQPHDEHLSWANDKKPVLAFEFCSDIEGAIRTFEQMKKTYP